MSRVRYPPHPRRDPRAGLFHAAATVFEERGIGSASIDAIAEAAGFTRGAFYSKFCRRKDELIVGMLEDHADRSVQHYPRSAGASTAPGR